VNPSCRTFRDHFEPGRVDEHRPTCPSCARFAAEVELATEELLPGVGANLPLPEDLATRLRAIARRDAGEADGGGSDGGGPDPLAGLRPLPSLPLPPKLAARLRAAGRARPVPAPPPWWLQSAAASVAASLVVVLLTGILFGNPVVRLSPLTTEFVREATVLWQRVTGGGESLVANAWAETREEARRNLVVARGSLASWSENFGRLTTLGPTTPADRPLRQQP